MKTPLLLALCAATALSTPIFAQDGESQRGKIKELEQRARTAKEQGDAEEAQKLMEQVRKLHAEMGEREGERGGVNKLELAKRKIEELRQAGKNEQADQLQHRLREWQEPKGEGKWKEQKGDGQKGEGKWNKGGDEAARRMHIMEAIKNLRSAGLNEPAERIEQLLRENDKKTAAENRAKPERRGSDGEGPEDKEEMRALRGMHEQMAKMERQIEELREQFEKQRGLGEHRKE